MTRGRLLELDRRWSQALRVAEKPGPLHVLAALLAHSGDSWFWGIGLAGVWLMNPDGPAEPLGDWRVWTVRITLGILALALVVLAIKVFVRRRRPEGEWGAIYRTADPHSFPSGHAARAALLLTLISAWGPAWLRPVLCLWAPAMSLARVGLGLHYLSDVAGGLALGASAGILWILLA
ncbi:MAG: phosphatase PAP2 family protein [Anaerolineales bacterium]